MEQEKTSEESRRAIVETGRLDANVPAEKSRLAPEAARLQVAHTCSRSAACRSAIFGTGRYAESDLVACDRRQLRPRVPAAAAPMTSPCLGSSGSAHRACA